MGHSFEAKEGEILFPHALRVQKVRMLIAQANREINVMASKSEVFDQMSDRSAVNDLVQQEKINYAAHFLSERKHGFANHHTKNTVLRSLLLASIQNTEHPQIVGIPQYDPSRLHIIFDRKNLSLDELEHEDVLRGHNNGIQAALRLLSDKNIGLLTRIPDPRSGIFTSTVRKRDGTTLFQAPTALLGVDINYSVPTTPQLAIVGTPQIWFDVHHLPAA